MVGTAKELAVLWLLDGLNVAPSDDRAGFDQVVRSLFPASSLNFTDKQRADIEGAFNKEAKRVRKMYAQYLKGRGHNVEG